MLCQFWNRKLYKLQHVFAKNLTTNFGEIAYKLSLNHKIEKVEKTIIKIQSEKVFLEETFLMWKL